jgi:hypothetical protein
LNGAARSPCPELQENRRLGGHREEQKGAKEKMLHAEKKDTYRRIFLQNNFIIN